MFGDWQVKLGLHKHVPEAKNINCNSMTRVHYLRSGRKGDMKWKRLNYVRSVVRFTGFYIYHNCFSGEIQSCLSLDYSLLHRSALNCNNLSVKTRSKCLYPALTPYPFPWDHDALQCCWPSILFLWHERQRNLFRVIVELRGFITFGRKAGKLYHFVRVCFGCVRNHSLVWDERKVFVWNSYSTSFFPRWLLAF